jgi:hypothetical protein
VRRRCTRQRSGRTLTALSCFPSSSTHSRPTPSISTPEMSASTSEAPPPRQGGTFVTMYYPPEKVEAPPKPANPLWPIEPEWASLTRWNMARFGASWFASSRLASAGRPVHRRPVDCKLTPRARARLLLQPLSGLHGVQLMASRWTRALGPWRLQRHSMSRSEAASSVVSLLGRPH